MGDQNITRNIYKIETEIQQGINNFLLDLLILS